VYTKIIDNRYLLKPDKWKAVVGLHHLYIHWPFSKEYHIKDIIVHSDYEFGTFENDVALFKLMQFVKYNDYVQPICLPDSAHFLSDKSKNPCYISGWGSSKEEGKSRCYNNTIISGGPEFTIFQGSDKPPRYCCRMIPGIFFIITMLLLAMSLA
uniref:Peptidase S1 domain-containing protein n=1 Tax=Laticauda laticaudata TaxID=8630 RepID=A0A8C5SFT0_LATLA